MSNYFFVFSFLIVLKNSCQTNLIWITNVLLLFLVNNIYIYIIAQYILILHLIDHVFTLFYFVIFLIYNIHYYKNLENLCTLLLMGFTISSQILQCSLMLGSINLSQQHSHLFTIWQGCHYGIFALDINYFYFYFLNRQLESRIFFFLSQEYVTFPFNWLLINFFFYLLYVCIMNILYKFYIWQ